MLLQAAHTFCVSVLYVHIVFDDKHVLNLMCVRECMCLPQIKLFLNYMYVYIYVYIMFMLINGFLYECRCIQHTVAHCILS